MTTYVFGDIQGCFDDLQRLLDKIGPASDDSLWFVGDLVNRGPKSLETIRFVKDTPNANTVLGNHDLHLVAIHAGIRKHKNKDTLLNILSAPDADEMIEWLCSQPLLHFDEQLNTAIVHAGIPIMWTMDEAILHANEIHSVFKNPALRADFIPHMYGNTPHRWKDTLSYNKHHRYIVNAFTRMRYCYKDGKLEFDSKNKPGTQPAGLKPWFKWKKRKSDSTKIVFGHWSTVGAMNEGNVICTDSGCIWGGKLTAYVVEEDRFIKVNSKTAIPIESGV